MPGSAATVITHVGRVRSVNGVRLMDFCRANGIRTLYMLDDNWFWLGREWQEYAGIFAPGLPDYETYTWNAVTGVNAATYYYLYVNGPSGTVIGSWYAAGSVCVDLWESYLEEPRDR